MSNKTTYAIITILYNDKRHQSIPLDIDNDADNRELVTLISEQGTTKLSMFKMPITDNKFIIFSREQLDNALFEIEITEKITRKKRTSQVEGDDSEITLLKS